jgi:hypothetical protein
MVSRYGIEKRMGEIPLCTIKKWVFSRLLIEQDMG